MIFVLVFCHVTLNLEESVSCKNLIWFERKLLRRQRLLSDARRNVRLYSRIKDRKSPFKGSRPSVPHGTNFVKTLLIDRWGKFLYLYQVSGTGSVSKHLCIGSQMDHVREGDPRTHWDETWTDLQDNGMQWRQVEAVVQDRQGWQHLFCDLCCTGSE